MAKWGEGDPRWIVEHRNDGKNVNGWHWQEVNKMEWTRQRLAELLTGAEAAGGSGAGWAAKVTQVKRVTGEAMLTTRKGNKRFAFYDLKLSLAWEAAPASGAGEPAAPHAADEEAEEEGDGEPSGGRGGDKAAPVSGEISVAEFGSGSDHDDIEVSVSTSGGSASAADKEAARRVAQQALWPLVLQRLEQYVKELSES